MKETVGIEVETTLASGSALQVVVSDDDLDITTNTGNVCVDPADIPVLIAALQRAGELLAHWHLSQVATATKPAAAKAKK